MKHFGAIRALCDVTRFLQPKGMGRYLSHFCCKMEPPSVFCFRGICKVALWKSAANTRLAVQNVLFCGWEPDHGCSTGFPGKCAKSSKKSSLGKRANTYLKLQQAVNTGLNVVFCGQRAHCVWSTESLEMTLRVCVLICGVVPWEMVTAWQSEWDAPVFLCYFFFLFLKRKILRSFFFNSSK